MKNKDNCSLHEEHHDHHDHEDGCGCSNPHSESKKALIFNFSRLLIVLLLTLIMIVVERNFNINIVVLYLIYGLLLVASGYNVLYQSFKNILKGKVFDEFFLMTIACVGAFIIREMYEAVLVMVFYGIGETLQQNAVSKSRAKIKGLMDLKIDTVNVKENNSIITKRIEDVKVNEIIVVKPGEKIGLDGVITFGSTYVDQSSITGESLMKRKEINDSVISGTINQNSLIEVKVSEIYENSTVSKILEMLENASNKKAKSEQFIRKFAKIYTPIIVIIAVLIAVIPVIFFNKDLNDQIYISLSFLLISCPCALVVSVPISYFAGLGNAAQHGILLKGSNYLESLAKLETVVFDKTGTLTKGTFEVTKVISDDENIIKYAAIAEKFSNHPIAKSIINYYNKDITESVINFEEISGKGIICESSIGVIYAGNSSLMEIIGIKNLNKYDETTIHIAKDDKYLGCILISDSLKESTSKAIKELKKEEISNLVMLTGDNKKTAEKISNELGLTSYKAELLPQDKVVEFEHIYKNKKKDTYAFVGDGINDAPVLARADIGIAMGGVGSDAAIEVADMVIMNDDLTKIAIAKKIAKKTRRIVIENITFALVTKIIVMILATIIQLNIVYAILADVGVAVIAVMNARRAMRLKEKESN